MYLHLALLLSKLERCLSCTSKWTSSSPTAGPTDGNNLLTWEFREHMQHLIAPCFATAAGPALSYRQVSSGMWTWLLRTGPPAALIQAMKCNLDPLHMWKEHASVNTPAQQKIWMSGALGNGLHLGLVQAERSRAQRAKRLQPRKALCSRHHPSGAGGLESARPAHPQRLSSCRENTLKRSTGRT